MFPVRTVHMDPGTSGRSSVPSLTDQTFRGNVTHGSLTMEVIGQ